MYYCNYDPALLTKKIVIPECFHDFTYDPARALLSSHMVLNCVLVKDKKDISCRVDLDSFGLLYITEISANINCLELFEFIDAKPCDDTPFFTEYTFRRIGTIYDK